MFVKTRQADLQPYMKNDVVWFHSILRCRSIVKPMFVKTRQAHEMQHQVGSRQAAEKPEGIGSRLGTNNEVPDHTGEHVIFNFVYESTTQLLRLGQLSRS
ncbi:hypothetical protein C0J52_03359 [Blattella germanica]|nr:hypothetical protein C0J52_03359 [Blattella germanica]